jgi:hypothetical protein
MTNPPPVDPSTKKKKLPHSNYENLRLFGASPLNKKDSCVHLPPTKFISFLPSFSHAHGFRQQKKTKKNHSYFTIAHFIHTSIGNFLKKLNRFAKKKTKS